MGTVLRTFWTNLAVDYRPAALSRRKQVPLRLFVIVTLCVTALIFKSMPFLFVWSIAYLGVQICELYALKRFINADDPTDRVWINLVSDVALATVFGWLALPLWEMGTPAGAAGAILLLSASIFTALMGAEGCMVAFISGAGPHVAYLFITPLVAGGGDDPVLPYFLIGGGLFSLTIAMTFLWSHRTMKAEREARRAAEAQVAARSALIAMVSHELRTPINAIVNGAGRLDAGGAGLIADAGRMMRTLLNDLLDLSKIEAGRMGVEMVDHDLRAQVSDTVDFWRGAAEAKGLTLTLTGAERLPRWVRGDPMRLRQVLNNLISNAVKFTTEGGVTVDIQPLAGGASAVEIEVRDTGPGLTEAQITRLFDPYEQLGGETARNFGGTGLGLAISRDLTRLMGGELAASPTPEGGARFVLRLPTPAGAEPATLEAAADESVGLVARADAPRILVVDDHDINRRTLRGILEAFGAVVEVAEDALSALAVCETQRFDAIVMDVRMPGMDGLEATRRLRAAGLNRQTPVVAVTGAVSAEEIAACNEAGMTACVAKPVSARELYAALFG